MHVMATLNPKRCGARACSPCSLMMQGSSTPPHQGGCLFAAAPLPCSVRLLVLDLVPENLGRGEIVRRVMQVKLGLEPEPLRRSLSEPAPIMAFPARRRAVDFGHAAHPNSAPPAVSTLELPHGGALLPQHCSRAIEVARLPKSSDLLWYAD